jgi:hypothetical protein
MIEQINNFIGQADSQVFGEFYTGLFYSCFSNKILFGFSQTNNAFRLRRITKSSRVDISVSITSKSDYGLPNNSDSVRFFDLLDIVGGNRRMAKISPVIKFKVLPKNFLVVDKWLSSLSEIYIDIEAASFSNEEVKEKISYKDLRIIESYQIENLASAKTASGTVVDVSSKNPAMITVTIPIGLPTLYQKTI